MIHTSHKKFILAKIAFYVSEIHKCMYYLNLKQFILLYSVGTSMHTHVYMFKWLCMYLYIQICLHSYIFINIYVGEVNLRDIMYILLETFLLK